MNFKTLLFKRDLNVSYYRTGFLTLLYSTCEIAHLNLKFA